MNINAPIHNNKTPYHDSMTLTSKDVITLMCGELKTRQRTHWTNYMDMEDPCLCWTVSSKYVMRSKPCENSNA